MFLLVSVVPSMPSVTVFTKHPPVWGQGCALSLFVPGTQQVSNTLLSHDFVQAQELAITPGIP